MTVGILQDTKEISTLASLFECELKINVDRETQILFDSDKETKAY